MSREDKLLKAAAKGDVGRMEKLLAGGVDVNAPAGEGASALYMAAAGGNAAAVAFLLDRGAIVDQADGVIGATPLMRAAEHADPSALRLLLDRGAEVNARANEGWTALHVAARANSAECARLLLERGADVNARGMQGDTPLRYAVAHGNDLVAEVLRAGGGTE